MIIVMVHAHYCCQQIDVVELKKQLWTSIALTGRLTLLTALEIS